MRSYEKDLTGSRWRGANVGEIRSLSKENLCILFTQTYTFIDFECLWLKRKTERNSHQTLIILRTVMMWVMNRLLEQVWAWMQMFCCLRAPSSSLSAVHAVVHNWASVSQCARWQVVLHAWQGPLLPHRGHTGTRRWPRFYREEHMCRCLPAVAVCWHFGKV